VYRYWNGAEWTERVQNFGDSYTDVVQQSFPAPTAKSEYTTSGVRYDSLPLHERTAIARLIAVPIGTVLYGVAAWFGLFGWTFLATCVYFILAFIVLPVALRTFGIRDSKRIDLAAELVAIVPAAAVLWVPLHAMGFHLHGGWSNVCWIVTSC